MFFSFPAPTRAKPARLGPPGAAKPTKTTTLTRKKANTAVVRATPKGKGRRKTSTPGSRDAVQWEFAVVKINPLEKMTSILFWNLKVRTRDKVEHEAASFRPCAVTGFGKNRI